MADTAVLSSPSLCHLPTHLYGHHRNVLFTSLLPVTSRDNLRVTTAGANDLNSANDLDLSTNDLRLDPTQSAMSEPLTMLELHVHTPAFDKECTIVSQGNPPSDDDGLDYSPSLLEKDPSSPSDASELEAHLYYFGIRGPRRRGPKLIFRTSKDVFTPPSGPEQDLRIMRLLPVYEHNELGKDDLWAVIRSKVVELLDQRNIQFSSIDLVRFSWVEENEEVEENENEEVEENENKEVEENEDDEDIEANIAVVAPYGSIVTTPVTIWIGVLPDTLTGEVASHSSKDILDLLKEHGISDVDVAYRESVVRDFSNSELFAPVSNFDPLNAVIDPVTTALGLPIAGLKTLRCQGTMGFYFRVGEDLYAVSARHVLFLADEDNNSYSYVAGPKKEVVLMGTKAFTNFLISIQDRIGILNHVVVGLEKQIRTLTVRSEGVGSNVERAARQLVEVQHQLGDTRAAIEELKKLFVEIKKRWTKPKDRIIGYVVWAPPISCSTPPHNYTKDVCVIKLDKKKFLQNFRGNVLDLGTEINAIKFISLMHPRIGGIDAPSDFDYPVDRLLELQGILSPEEIRTPNNKNHNGIFMRYVIKRGLTSLTTIGCLTGFESQVRRYSVLGKRDSVEAAVLPHDNHCGPFSMGGDSGSIIVDALGKFVALLTSGSGPTDSSDITYGSPMYWLWEVIQAQFPGANLSFELDDNN